MTLLKAFQEAGNKGDLEPAVVATLQRLGPLTLVVDANAPQRPGFVYRIDTNTGGVKAIDREYVQRVGVAVPPPSE